MKKKKIADELTIESILDDALNELEYQEGDEIITSVYYVSCDQLEKNLHISSNLQCWKC